MTARELKRKLAKLGCTFEEGTRHEIALYQGKKSPLPHHPSKEIKKGTLQRILKDLGIREL